MTRYRRGDFPTLKFVVVQVGTLSSADQPGAGLVGTSPGPGVSLGGAIGPDKSPVVMFPLVIADPLAIC